MPLKEGRRVSLSRGTFLQILGLSGDAAPDAIKVAFRKVIKKTHPDLTGNQKDHERFIRLRHAYEYYIEAALKRPPQTEQILVSESRIRYSLNMVELARARLLQKKFRKKDLLFHVGHDIEITLHDEEIGKNVIIPLQTVVRIRCVCDGMVGTCRVCKGSGWRRGNHRLYIKLGHKIKLGKPFQLRLSKIKLPPFVSFTRSSLMIMPRKATKRLMDQRHLASRPA